MFKIVKNNYNVQREVLQTCRISTCHKYFTKRKIHYIGRVGLVEKTKCIKKTYSQTDLNNQCNRFCTCIYSKSSQYKNNIKTFVSVEFHQQLATFDEFTWFTKMSNIGEIIKTTNYDDLLKRYEHCVKNKKYGEMFNIPFPIAVYGTLMRGYRNNNMMGNYEYRWVDMSRGVLPHFHTEHLMLWSEENANTPVEIFHYDDVNFQKAIKYVDTLERFKIPNNEMQIKKMFKNIRGTKYIRSLSWIYILPKDIEKEMIPNFYEGNTSLFNLRNIKYIKEEYKQWKKIPCWVYSNASQNFESNKLECSPLIFPKKKYTGRICS